MTKEITLTICHSQTKEMQKPGQREEPEKGNHTGQGASNFFFLGGGLVTVFFFSSTTDDGHDVLMLLTFMVPLLLPRAQPASPIHCHGPVAS